MPVILEIKVSLTIIKKFLYQCYPPYSRRVSSHRVLHLSFLGSYNICTIYLHVIEACLKVIVKKFYFCQSKNSSNIMKNIFNSISIYSWQKMSSLAYTKNKKNKHALFYKQQFYKQRQAESEAIPWGWTFAFWKLFIFFIHVIMQK